MSNLEIKKMNKKVTLVLFSFIVGTFTVFGSSKTDKFKVQGNCGMCETRIENAAKTIEGVTSAEWDKETKEMTVTYAAEKVSQKQIQTAITMSGHSTELFQASEAKYKQLPGCCQYEREKQKKSSHHSTSGCSSMSEKSTCNQTAEKESSCCK